MIKLAILTAGFKPTPAVEGGAVEMLTTWLIEENEKNPRFFIDVYTVESTKLDGIRLLHGNIIQSVRPNPARRGVYRVVNAVFKLLRLPIRVSAASGGIARDFRKRAHEYDAVIVEGSVKLCLRVRKLRPQVKLALHLHNHVLSDGASTLREWRSVCREANLILTASNYLTRELTAASGGAGRIETLENCLDFQLFPPRNPSEGVPFKKHLGLESEFVVLFAGRLNRDKGVLELAEAVAELPAEMNVSCVILGKNWFGSKGEERYIQSVRRICEASPHKIILAGAVEYGELSACYDAADCVAIPSLWDEPFGMVALEAMSKGLPVIATRSGGLQDVVDEHCAILISRENVKEELKDAIRKLYDAPELRARMGQAGRTRAMTRFSSPDDYFRRFAAAIETLGKDDEKG